VSRDLQVQERMTMQIAERLERELRPRGVGVVLRAEHTCMTTRGALATGALTTTSRFTGALTDDERLRSRFD
jgi:GTP cyclohydrolase I